MSKEKKTKSKFNKAVAMANIVSYTILIGLGGSIGINALVANSRCKGVDNKLVMRTDFGVPIIANLGFDKTVDIVVDETFNKTQKASIKEAIEELDVDLKGVRYNILLNDEKAGKECINITKSNSDDFNKNAFARTDMNINNYFGTVLYPVQITIFSDVYNANYSDPDFNKEAISGIVKHEMLHTLGFSDVYDNEYQNKTIMYGNLDKNTTLYDLSQFDKDMVNSVYTSVDDTLNYKVDTFEPFMLATNLTSKAEEDMSM